MPGQEWVQYQSLHLLLEGEAIHKAWEILNVVFSPSLQTVLDLRLRSARNNLLTVQQAGWTDASAGFYLACPEAPQTQ